MPSPRKTVLRFSVENTPSESDPEGADEYYRVLGMVAMALGRLEGQEGDGRAGDGAGGVGGGRRGGRAEGQQGLEGLGVRHQGEARPASQEPICALRHFLSSRSFRFTQAPRNRLAAVCRKAGVRLIPEFQCLGHQSWRGWHNVAKRQTGGLTSS